jgi:hypothetical protein
MAALVRAARLVPALADGEVTIDALAAIGFEVLHVDRFMFVLFDPTTGGASQRAMRVLDESITLVAPRSDIFERVREEASLVRGGADARAWTCAPVRRRGAIVGALYVDAGAPLDAGSIELVECLAALASIAIFR